MEGDIGVAINGTNNTNVNIGYATPLWMLCCHGGIHGASALALSVLALLTWRHLEVAHPVFAVLEQNLMVLASLATVGTAVYIGRIIHVLGEEEEEAAEEEGGEGRRRAASFVTRFLLQEANQFNQVSWLVITYLR